MTHLSFGFIGTSVDPLSAVEWGVVAEKVGFDTFWLPDHFTDIDGDKLEPWTILSAISAKTSNIKLASAVTDTQRSHPARTAHAVACLDVLSRGRAILGIGAGEAMNILPFGLPWESPHDRVLRLEEAIKIIHLLWSSSRDNRKNFSGRFCKLENAFLSQSPKRRPHPPVYVGAFSSRKTLEVVGRLGDGWYSWLNTPETFQERWAVIQQSARSSLRSARSIMPCSHLMVAFPRNSAEKRLALLSGKAVLLMERSVLRKLGYSHLLSQYQHVMADRDDVAKIMNEAQKIPDEFVYRTMALGSDAVEERIEELTNAGVRHFAVADLLAPKTVPRTLAAFKGVIKAHS
jgi:phthiodiolone/phenolphthiodiolone dimycocerosates ketoreductase